MNTTTSTPTTSRYAAVNSRLGSQTVLPKPSIWSRLATMLAGATVLAMVGIVLVAIVAAAFSAFDARPDVDQIRAKLDARNAYRLSRQGQPSGIAPAPKYWVVAYSASKTGAARTYAIIVRNGATDGAYGLDEYTMYSIPASAKEQFSNVQEGATVPLPSHYEAWDREASYTTHYEAMIANLTNDFHRSYRDANWADPDLRMHAKFVFSR